MGGAEEGTEKLFNWRKKRRGAEEVRGEGGSMEAKVDGYHLPFSIVTVAQCTHRQQVCSALVWLISFKPHHKTSSDPCYYLSELVFPQAIYISSASWSDFAHCSLSNGLLAAALGNWQYFDSARAFNSMLSLPFKVILLEVLSLTKLT